MGYRDDTAALEGRREVLAREVESLEGELSSLKKESDELRRTIARKRIKLAVYRVGRWMAGHPKTMIVLFIITGLVLGGWIKSVLDAREHQALVNALLGRDCAYRLKVDASHRGAAVLVNGLKVGKAPATIPICPDTYRLRVVHRHTLPWQRVITIPDDIPGSGKELPINASLINWRPSRRPQGGVVVFSAPPGALLFVDGKEAGTTPVFLSGLRDKGKLRLGVWAGDEHAKVMTVDSKPAALWVHMGPGRKEPRR